MLNDSGSGRCRHAARSQLPQKPRDALEIHRAADDPKHRYFQGLRSPEAFGNSARPSLSLFLNLSGCSARNVSA